MYLNNSEVFVVHCVDAEGPLNETVCATFERLKYIFNIELPATEENYNKLRNGEIEGSNTTITSQLKTTFSGGILEYNRNWSEIDKMNTQVFSSKVRNEHNDDFGNAWKISWFCLDHVNYTSNPREKAEGYSVVFNYYKNLIEKHPNYGDELQWHFHPKSISLNPIAAATSYSNSLQEIIQILTRKVLDDGWFPSTFRPGFHAERQDSNLFLEQWFPYDYGNQKYSNETSQQDMQNGRFGNWGEAPSSWRGYHPSIKRPDLEGNLNRTIFRCLNLGTRHRILDSAHIREAFVESVEKGNAVIAFTDHDFRDIIPDIRQLQEMLKEVKAEFPEVKVRYCTAEEAARRLQGQIDYDFALEAELNGNLLSVKEVKGEIFGSQPFLAIRDSHGNYHHDNFDFVDAKNTWYYTFDEQTINLDDVDLLGIASSGKFGGYSVLKMNSKGLLLS